MRVWTARREFVDGLLRPLSRSDVKVIFCFERACEHKLGVQD
jgi:hypothetical protein